MASRTRGGRPKRQERKRGLVVMEGRVTEPQYLDLLKQVIRGPVSVTIVGMGADPARVLHEAEKKARAAGEKYDWICCVVDVDQHTTLDEMLRVARKSGEFVVVTNLKFEQWLLWHVDEGLRELGTKELDVLMKKRGLMNGKQLSPKFPIEDYEKAVEVARRADLSMELCRKGRCPSSSMPLLIELMQGKNLK